ncbi:MAG: hypothetical protein HOV80_14545 [Polyangiaceae bacterium]|nr:hypothetical protein [Polyangiaceae bacterium]
MGPTANSVAVAMLLFGSACSADGSSKAARLPAPKTARPRASASPSAPAPSESVATEQPKRIDVAVTDRDGRADADFVRLFPTGVPFDGCLDKSAVGDRGTLFVTIGGEGRPNPEIEHEGLSQPFLRCLMEDIVEAQAQSGTSIERFIYVSVE